MNQPLAAIVANGQACLRFLSRETPDLVEVRDAVEWMVKDGNRAGEVIQRVGRLLRKTDVEKAPVHVNEIINDAAAMLQRELNSHNVSLRRELAPALPLAIADRVQLQQVIINLVLNGSEAMQAVTSRPRELLVRSHLDEAHQLVVAVKDMGIGLPVVANDRVFEAFFTTKPNGLGMGLSICRSIIEKSWREIMGNVQPGGAGRDIPVRPAGTPECELTCAQIPPCFGGSGGVLGANLCMIFRPSGGTLTKSGHISRAPLSFFGSLSWRLSPLSRSLMTTHPSAWR